MSIKADIQSLAPGTKVDMFEVDTGEYGLGILRYASHANPLGQDIVWQGNTYIRFPVTVEGYKQSSGGTLARPTMSLGNIGGLIGQLFRLYNNFLGCKVTRKRTLLKYLDSVNFSTANGSADPNAFLPDEVYYIDRLVEATPQVVRMELAVSWDVKGVRLPFRQIIRDTCIWEYRGSDCGYAGGAVATVADVPTTNLPEDRCSKHMSGCRLRFPQPAEIPASFFPSVGTLL